MFIKVSIKYGLKPRQDEPAKVQKGIIKDIMRGDNGREQNADWLPAYFRFPASAQSDRGGIAIVDKWNSVAALLHTAM